MLTVPAALHTVSVSKANGALDSGLQLCMMLVKVMHTTCSQVEIYQCSILEALYSGAKHGHSCCVLP